MNFTTLNYIVLVIIGYFMGSLLFAKLWGYVFTHRDITLEASDHNPGAFNAFAQGGFFCGVLTVICDLGKGFVPVYLCLRFVDVDAGNELLMALVMLAPIVGHILPVFHKFKGGKGIAVTFGVLLGFVPDLRPVLLLAVIFIIFAVILVIKPNIYKTMATFVIAGIICPFMDYRIAIVITYIVAAVIICIRLLLSKEKRDDFSLSFFKWHIWGDKEGQSKI